MIRKKPAFAGFFIAGLRMTLRGITANCHAERSEASRLESHEPPRPRFSPSGWASRSLPTVAQNDIAGDHDRKQAEQYPKNNHYYSQPTSSFTHFYLSK